MLKNLPPSFAAISRRLMRRKGVVGVFWGVADPGKGGRCRIRVHVERKIPDDELTPAQAIRSSIDGIRTRVVQVGTPRAQVLTCKEIVRNGSDARVSTQTALIRKNDDEWYALLCGHGTLPIRGGGLVTDFPNSDHGPSVQLHDVSSGTSFQAKVIAGRLTGIQDWTIARADVPDGPIDLTSPVTGTYRPSLRTSMLARDEPVRHYSCLDRASRRGTVAGYGRVLLRIDNGMQYLYTSTFEVFGQSGAFSRDGDSGSLVVDANGRAIGILLGRAEPDSDPTLQSYVLPFISPSGSVIPNLQRFFS